MAELLQDSLRALDTEEDPIVWQRHTLDFWDHVVDSAGSIVDRLMYNAFRAAYEPTLAALTTTMTAAAKRPSDYRKLADAICSGDPTGAKKAAQDLLELANTSLMAVLVSQASRQ
ncbi:GntR family transcriptional regulator [Mycobacterium tuberculosis]|nr:GntR family transcriptional regulator [Mycobacterium tuberculosis]COW93885.1 GntR family transcriptional regulator [Mycobacterium tuberculosis]COW99139.1 GntR family transcriptional regulator [Mycobacterium tuberculosis]CPA04085.1 GntR family transcriptional regulator [Mycobacterium tuberculosis]